MEMSSIDERLKYTLSDFQNRHVRRMMRKYDYRLMIFMLIGWELQKFK